MTLRALKYLLDETFHDIRYGLGLLDKQKYAKRKQKYSAFFQCLQRQSDVDLVLKGSVETYLDYLKMARGDKSFFTPLTERAYADSPDQAKVLAYYLPQFHQIPLNDENFGRGFTEWTNVTTSPPLYPGHHQPQIPVDVGFYDLSHPDVMYRQVELAKLYGIYGFCFYYYWFSGRKILEKPLYNWLRHTDLDRNFCFFWANEPWTKVWVGEPDKVICPQNYAPGDEDRFFYDALPFFEDSRYIKIRNCPVLIIYQPWAMGRGRCLRFTDRLRELAQRSGFAGLSLLAVETGMPLSGSLVDWGFDGMTEFLPYGLQNLEYDVKDNQFVAPDAMIRFFSMERYLEEKRYLQPTDHLLYKSVFPSWDNSSRHGSRGASIYEGITPESYQKWLENICRYTQEKFPVGERYVFINAWNEWAEGAHLEPDNRYGYTWLEATRAALESSQPGTPTNERKKRDSDCNE